MKCFKIIFWVCLPLAVCLAYVGRTSYNYSLRCAKCLAGRHVIERHFLGVTVSTNTEERDPPADYERIFGRPCEHVFHKGGFGRSSVIGVSCGMTNEGLFISPRMNAVTAVFKAELRLHDRELALATFQLIDELAPPDGVIKPSRSPAEIVRSKAAHNTLFRLASVLNKAETAEHWRAALDAARQGLGDTKNLSGG